MSFSFMAQKVIKIEDIGGISNINAHSFKKLYDLGVNIAICTDVPEVFKSSINDEVDFVIKNFNITEEELSSRLGEPYRFKLNLKSAFENAIAQNIMTSIFLR